MFINDDDDELVLFFHFSFAPMAAKRGRNFRASNITGGITTCLFALVQSTSFDDCVSKPTTSLVGYQLSLSAAHKHFSSLGNRSLKTRARHGWLCEIGFEMNRARKRLWCSICRHERARVHPFARILVIWLICFL